MENFCIAAFRSRLHVMAFERTLNAAGMKASVVTTPRAVALGCGLSVRFDEKDAPRVKALYQASGLGNLIGFYRVTRDQSGRAQVYPLR